MKKPYLLYMLASPFFRRLVIGLLTVVALLACVYGLIQASNPTPTPEPIIQQDSLILSRPLANTDSFPPLPAGFLDYARSLIGTPYVYASTDPTVGFDCSGFITHVFNHFNLSVPRSSVDFTNYGIEIPLKAARAGDLILFTGTESTSRVVGHMGIVAQHENEQLQFIHSTSGKAYGVTITPLNPYYMGRFVKTIRVFDLP
jgi:hypothetical protein